jgi:hypothetical protein
MIAYTLNKNISIENLSKDINGLVEKFRKDYPEKIPILTIDIRTITRDDTSLIPKLEYKGDCLT